MSIKPFTSESYAEADRGVAWRDLLSAFGLRTAASTSAPDRLPQPGDVLEVRILDIAARASRNPDFEGRVFGSSVAHGGAIITENFFRPKPREAVTIYEVFPDDEAPFSRALYSYLWEPQTDPSGVVHKTYDYPGVPVMPEAYGDGTTYSMDFAFRCARISASSVSHRGRPNWSIPCRRPISVAT